MPKLFVEVMVSATGQSVDFALPDQVSVEKLMILITEALNKHVKLTFPYQELTLAYAREDKNCVLLPMQSTLAGEGICDGAKLILI